MSTRDQLKVVEDLVLGSNPAIAKARLKNLGYSGTVVRVGFENFPTFDGVFDPDRVQLCVENGLIVKAEIG